MADAGVDPAESERVIADAIDNERYFRERGLFGSDATKIAAQLAVATSFPEESVEDFDGQAERVQAIVAKMTGQLEKDGFDDDQA